MEQRQVRYVDIKEFFQKLIAKFKYQKSIEAPRQDNQEYQRYAKSIDDLSLARMFVDQIRTKEFEAFESKFLTKGKLSDYPYRTPLNIEQAQELAREFFASVDPQFSQMAEGILNSTNADISLSFVPKAGKNRSDVNAPNDKNKHMNIRVVDSGTIVTLYELVHEMTHTFDTENGDTTTRRLFGEVAPQCVERLLDEFLLNMSEEQAQKYSFDKETIKRDVLDRKIATLLARYHNADERTADKDHIELTNRYMLAQVYATQFEEMNAGQKLESLHKIMDAIKNNDFEAATQAYGINISKENEIQRKACIDALRKNVDRLVLQKQTELSDGPTKWHTVNIGLDPGYKSFYHEIEFDKAQKKFEDDPDKRADLIIAKDGKMVGVCEVDILPGGVARMCRQDEIHELLLPMGIDDSYNIANGNDMPAIQVCPEYKGKGLGKKMLEAAIKYAKANGANRLSIEQINHMAKPFYEKFGIQYKDDFNGEIDLEAENLATVDCNTMYYNKEKE